jgi:hypothetical protein
MKTKEAKVAVLIVSKQFLSYHPRAGQETNFKPLIQNAIGYYTNGLLPAGVEMKPHTVRGNRAYWEGVIERKMTLSIRQWSGKPRASKQEKIIDLPHGEWGIQFITLMNLHDGLHAFVGSKSINIDTLSKNDGLSRADFEDWFAPKFERDDIFEGVIIHFTPNFRY